MKKRVWWMCLLLSVLALAACGGQGAPEPAAEVETAAGTAPAEEEAAPAEEDAAPAEEPAAEETTAEGASADTEAAAVGDMIAGRPASGTDPDTGLEINPDTITPGADFIVRGELVNHNLTPIESPEFMVIAPSGVRYRIRSQPVPDIFFEDGTQPAPHEYKRGMLIQATVRQEENAGATTVVDSSDLVLLQE